MARPDPRRDLPGVFGVRVVRILNPGFGPFAFAGSYGGTIARRRHGIGSSLGCHVTGTDRIRRHNARAGHANSRTASNAEGATRIRNSAVASSADVAAVVPST